MPTDNTLYTEPVRDIMHYESDIWAVADLLLAASIKRSDFPAYMMPFFALVMLEGRMRNAVQRVMDKEGTNPKDDPEEFKEAFLDEKCGYNEYIVMQDKTLAAITMNDATFDGDFAHYLSAFDRELKVLLGINIERGSQRYLNMDGIVTELRKKGILFSVAQAWAKVDLSAYDNSAITTLEEHIKRKWADLSASTAGEQYTPDDIISLIAEIVSSKVSKPKEQWLHVYDPTCGGANLLFGVADKLVANGGYRRVATYGSEYNDALYALAAIESRFRKQSKIHYGNTLTTVPFPDNEFDVIVANPPYGTKWTGYEKEVKKDEQGQFPAGYPSTSDGQLLFMQHILWKLADTGIAVEVHNGSTLFSGDAGGGESNIRKYIFDHDWVEAIIQMPQNEFFNTGIYTYLWVMNKNKHQDPVRRGKVALIDGSGLWQLLKKAKGDKRREIPEEGRRRIVEALMTFESSDICKIYDREYFYYNKQSLLLTEVSEKGLYVEQTICTDGKPFAIKHPVSLTVGKDEYADITLLSADEVKQIAKRITEERLSLSLSVTTEEGDVFAFVPDERTILHTDNLGKTRDLGCGMFSFKATVNKKGSTIYKISIEPYLVSDYEIIPHHFDAEENNREILAFMDKYVFKPYVLTTNKVGVELNFNKEFYVPEEISSVENILAEIKKLDPNASIKCYEIECTPNSKFKPSGVDWIGEIPEGWKVKRIKEIGFIASGTTPKSSNDLYYENGVHPWLNTGCVQDCIINEPAKYITDLALKDCNGLSYYPRDTILIAMYGGGTIGNVGLMNISATINQACCAIVLDKHRAISKYLFYCMLYNKNKLISNGFGGTQINLSQSQIANYLIVIPPLSEQQSIATYLDEKCSEIDANIANLEKQIEKYKELKRALISEVVTGKRRV